MAKAAAARPRRIPSEAEVRAMGESDYMNEGQLQFFQALLTQMRADIVDRQIAVKDQLNEHEQFADPADRATAEEEYALALRLREREAILLKKIDESLARIRRGEYGYCTATGDPIGVARLIARPTASVCVHVKDQSERIEVHFRAH
jgi:DnaK suppressor protein